MKFALEISGANCVSVMCTPASRWYQSLTHIQYVLSLPLAIRYKVAYKKDTGECKLEISMTFADDAGEYSVFAKNQLGEVSASASLLEEGKRTSAPEQSNFMFRRNQTGRQDMMTVTSEQDPTGSSLVSECFHA